MKCILLHGLGQTPADWNDAAKNIDENFEVCCPALFDWLQGGACCFTNLYQGFEKYCEQFDEPLVLGGISLGGILALQYAIEHSNKVRALILIGAQFSMPKKLLKFQNMVFWFLPNTVFRKIGASKKEIISLCNSMMALDFMNDLKDIHCRTLILCGRNDKANYAASVQLKENIASSEFLVVSNAGHEINKDNPNKLGEIINAFLLQLSPHCTVHE